MDEVAGEDAVSSGDVGVAEIDGRCRLQQQRVVAGAAIDAVFRAAIGDAIIPAAAVDDIAAAGAVDRVVARAAGQDVDAGRADDRDRLAGVQRGGVDVLEVADGGGVAAGLIGCTQVDVGLGQHHQRVVVDTTIDQRLRAAIGHRIVAGTGMNDVGAAGTVDHIIAGAAGNRVGGHRAGDRHTGRERGRIDILEIGDIDGVAGGLVGVAKVDGDRGRKIERVGSRSAIDQRLAAAIDDRIVAAEAQQRIRAARAVEGVVAGSTGQDVCAGIACQRVGARRRAGQIGDSDQRVAGRQSCRPGPCRQIDDNASRRTAVVDGIGAAVSNKRIAAAATVENVVARGTGEPVGVGRAFDIAEVLKDVCLGIAAEAGTGRQVDRNALVRIFVGYGVVAGAAVEIVVAGSGINQVIACASRDVRAGRRGVQSKDRRLAIGRHHVDIGVAVHITNDESLAARIESARAAGVDGAKENIEVEAAEEAVAVGYRGRSWQHIPQFDLQMVRIVRIERNDPVRAALNAIVDSEACRKVRDRRGLCRDPGIRKRYSDIEQALGRSRRHAVRIGGIDDVVLAGADQRPHLLLNGKRLIGGRRDFRGRAEDAHAAGRQPRGLIARNAEQRDVQFGCADVARSGARARIGHSRQPVGRVARTWRGAR